MGEVERQIGADEPPALAPNAALAMIGKPVPRQNGRAKVTGATRFTVDITLPGMLHGRILRSPQPHAQVRAIDSVAAARYPGVRAIMPIVTPGDPATATVRYIGAPIAAVAAVSMAGAEEALRLIRVDYKSLPFVVDMDKAREPTAPAVYDSASAPAGHASGFPAAAGPLARAAPR
jgi:xanthine dehydrogenase YagR molybdenum-binding subunit